jgi:hypothetical protein
MKIILIVLPFFLAATCLWGCHPGRNNNPGADADSADKKASLSIPSNTVPEYRKIIKKEAIAEYKEKVDDPLNDWYFSVSLYETPKTFHYLLKLQFEELRGEDTLILPNFGNEPKPALQKGKDKYSCLIGFIDKNDSFREYKLVSVKEGREIKLSTLHHYAVDTYLEEK